MSYAHYQKKLTNGANDYTQSYFGNWDYERGLWFMI